ncbi:MAG: hypothetical protein K8L99_20170 [Anaerolineae bacterium]|nr:hypothetical protein [Anaerolineae bacterium]
MKRGLFFFIVPAFLLVACDNAPGTTLASSAFYNNTLYDEQGPVSIAVTPLTTSDETLEFDIAMNTHSVELSMDLATLSILSNDRGQTVTPLTWDAPQSGHHVTGKLIFPVSVDGGLFLDGAKQVTLIIREVSVPERVFEWFLDQGS